MGSSDVLVYQFQTDGWWSTGRVTFTRSNDTALWDTDPVVSDSGGSYGSPLTMSDFTFYNGSDAQMMFGGGSGYYANVSYGSYGGSYSNYISTDDWENNLYQDRYNNLFIASGTGSLPHKQDSVVYEGMGSYSYAPSGTLTQDQMVLDAVGRSFAESGGSDSGSGSGSYGGGSGSYGGGLVAMVVDPVVMVVDLAAMVVDPVVMVVDLVAMVVVLAAMVVDPVVMVVVLVGSVAPKL